MECKLFTKLSFTIPYCMEQSLSCKADRFSASQEILHIERNPKVHYHIHGAESFLQSWQVFS